MKKLFWWLSTVLMLTVLIVGASLSASAEIVSGTCGKYHFDTDKEDPVNWSYNTSTKVLTISGEGEIDGRPWIFDYRNAIQTVVIGEGVTSVCGSAFENCVNLRSVQFPSTMESVAYTAFSGCNALIQVENGVSYVEKWVIDCDKSATSITLRNDTVGFGVGAFSESSIMTIAIPDNVTSIGSFSYCDNLIKVTFGENSKLKTIQPSAFYKCGSLMSINLPSGVTSIGDEAFYQCKNLTNIELPSSLTYIGNRAFAFCDNLVRVEIPAGVTDMAEWTFYACSGLQEVEFAANSKLTSIGEYTFSSCRSLTKVWFGENSKLTTIGEKAFDWCEKLESINIPSGVTSIGKEAFYYCQALTSVVLPDALTIVEERVFGSSGLKTVYVPTEVLLIKSYAFACFRLEKIVYCGTEAQWNAIVKQSNWDGGRSGKYIVSYHDYDWESAADETFKGTCVYCGAVTESETAPPEDSDAPATNETPDNQTTAKPSDTTEPNTEKAPAEENTKEPTTGASSEEVTKEPTEESTEEETTSDGITIHIPSCKSSVSLGAGLIFLLSVGAAGLLCRKEEL